MKLESDFRDYYDYAFPSQGKVTFYRNANDRSMSKLDQFHLLQKLDLRTPMYGTPKVLYANGLGNDELVVVYTDDKAHCGEGKEMVDLSLALENHPNTLCSQWINTASSFDESRSYRLLQIGDRAWWLKYEGQGGWMSNHCEETTIYIESECKPIDAEMLRPYPLFAIDFVYPVNTPYNDEIDLVNGYAIDFNSAPGMKWTGINEILQPWDVYKLLSDFVSRNWLLM